MLFERQIVDLPFMEVQMWPLLERHYKEISAYQDIELKPDFRKYLAMQEAGSLRVFVAKDMNENKLDLVGYAVFFVNKNLHYSDSLQAVQDVLYLEKSQRGKGIGGSFIDWCDSQLKEDGVQVVYHHVKTKFNFGLLLESIGYKHIENIYGRRLDGI